MKPRYLIVALFASILLLLTGCSDPASDSSGDLENQLKDQFPHYTGLLRYAFDDRCELPCWEFYLDTLPIAFNFNTVDFVGSQATVWGPIDTAICNGHLVARIFADSVVFAQSDSQIVDLVGRIYRAPYSEFGCSDYRFITECDTFDFQTKEALLDTLEDSSQPLSGLVGYLVEMTAQYWERACHHRLAVIDAAGIEEERSAVGRVVQCDSTLPGCGGDFVLLGRGDSLNWRGVYSLESNIDLYTYLFADSIAAYGRTAYPKPFVTGYPVLRLDSLTAFTSEPVDCVTVIGRPGRTR